MSFINHNLLFDDWWHTDELIKYVADLDFKTALSYVGKYVLSDHPFIRRWGYVMYMGGQTMKIEHIAMYVNDLEKARSFFIQYLGARSNEGYHNPKTDFRSYFLSFDDGARLEIMNKPGMKDEEKAQARTGYIHIAFSLGSKERVDALTKKLREDGYEVISGPRTTGDGYYESCMIGIEENQIELTV